MIPEKWFQYLAISQFVVMLGLFTLLGVAKLSGTPAENVNDLVMHASGYFVAVFSGFIALYRLERFRFVILGLWLFSFFIEIVQYYLPWRSFSLLDLLANGSGLLIGYIVLYFIKAPLLHLISKISA